MEKGHFECAYREGRWQPVEERDVAGMIAFTGQNVASNMRRLRMGNIMVTRVARYRWLPGPAPVIDEYEMVEA